MENTYICWLSDMLSVPGNLAVYAVELSFQDKTQLTLEVQLARIIKLCINLKLLKLSECNFC